MKTTPRRFMDLEYLGTIGGCSVRSVLMHRGGGGGLL